METQQKFCVNCGNPITVGEGQKIANCPKCGTVFSLEQKVIISKDGDAADAAVKEINEDIQRSGKPETKLFSITCSACGGTVAVKEGQKIAQCQFCGNSIAVDDGIRRIEIVNEAQKLQNKIDREELDKKKAAHEQFQKYYAAQRHKRILWRFIYAIAAVIFYVIIVLAAYIGYDSDGGGMVEKLVFAALGYFLFMPVIINIFRPHLPRSEDDRADTSKVKSMVLTWLLYLGVLFLAGVTSGVVIVFM